MKLQWACGLRIHPAYLHKFTCIFFLICASQKFVFLKLFFIVLTWQWKVVHSSIANILLGRLPVLLLIS